MKRTLFKINKPTNSVCRAVDLKDALHGELLTPQRYLVETAGCVGPG